MTKEIAIFAKKRRTADGKKSFFTFLTTLENRSGESVTMSVKFADDGAPKPEDCPMNIIVEKTDCNISEKTFIREDTGEMATSKTMWVKAWKAGTPYVDHSTDEFF